MSAAAPAISFTEDEITRLFAPLTEAAAVVAAVWGGPDSMALMHLLAEWKSPNGRPPVVVATVDHGLREEARAEADLVASFAARLGLPHRLLSWIGPKPRSGIQEAAREARYRLLLDLARQEGASHLVTAHTQDDQAETVLMRLSRGSGLTGLVGMRPSVDRGGIRHVRPLLVIPKARLVALCRAQGWPFVEDPSNADPRFARARWRRLMPALAAEGLSAERLARLAERALRVEEALDLKARDALARAGLAAEAGTVCLQGAVLAEEPFEIALRVLGLALLACRGEADPWRLQRLESCTERLRQALGRRERLRLTLAGTVILLNREGRIHISPEPPRRRGRYPIVREDAAGAPHSLGKGEGHA